MNRFKRLHNRNISCFDCNSLKDHFQELLLIGIPMCGCMKSVYVCGNVSNRKICNMGCVIYFMSLGVSFYTIPLLDTQITAIHTAV